VSPIAGKLNHDDMRIDSLQSFEELEGGVGGAVVYVDDLPIVDHAFKGGGNCLVKASNEFLLVIDGNNY